VFDDHLGAGLPDLMKVWRGGLGAGGGHPMEA
jgi:hypothetical protein